MTLRDEGVSNAFAAQDDVGGPDSIFRRRSNRDPRFRDLGRGQYHQFSAANPDPGGYRCDSYVFARPAGDENVSRTADSHQGNRPAVRNCVFCVGWAGGVVRPVVILSERERCMPIPSLPRTTPRLLARFILT